MKIAFLHYHLKTGGVTTVLRQQLAAIGKKEHTLVLTGLAPETPFPADFVHIPELGYSSQYKKKFNPDDVANLADTAMSCMYTTPPWQKIKDF